MNRKQIESDYELNEHSMITSPGKFEGEMLYAPYFWDAVLDGGSDDNVNGADYLKLTAEDKLEFPELIGAYGVRLQESEQGFVRIFVIDTQAEYETEIAIEHTQEMEDDEC